MLKHWFAFRLTEDLVGVFDDTANASLTLWGSAMLSVQHWVPSETILLITNPTCRLHNNQTSISLSKTSFVDVNPTVRDGQWLRQYARKLVKREHVNPVFPNESTYDPSICPLVERLIHCQVLNLREVLANPVQALYSLAEVDGRSVL